MESFDIYVLVLCLVVYTALVALFSVMIGLITKQSLCLIRLGAEDDKIREEAAKKTRNNEDAFGESSKKGFSSFFAPF